VDHLPDTMTVTILGSGTCVPSLIRSASSTLIRLGDRRLLIDCGPGTMRRLLETGTDIFDIDVLMLTHFHPDHCGELVPFLFANKYPDGSKRWRPLMLVGGPGVAEFFLGLQRVFGHWIELTDPLFQIMELDGVALDRTEFKGMEIAGAAMAHNPESIGYRITDPSGRSLAVSGDTDVTDRLVDLARDVDLLICESAFPDEAKTKGHLTPSEAGAIATQARVGRLVLTHFYPKCETSDIIGQCRRTWQGPLVLAKDLLSLVLGP